jgi:hypothetical protein
MVPRKISTSEKCANGHIRSEENTYKNGTCKLCALAAKEKHKRSKGVLSREARSKLQKSTLNFPCGHPRTPENSNSKNNCKTCACIRAESIRRSKDKIPLEIYQDNLANKTECKYGHPLSREIRTSDGHCPTCREIKSKQDIELVKDSYVAHVCRLPVALLSPDIIQLKRENILLKRSVLRLKQTLEEKGE